MDRPPISLVTVNSSVVAPEAVELIMPFSILILLPAVSLSCLLLDRLLTEEDKLLTVELRLFTVPLRLFTVLLIGATAEFTALLTALFMSSVLGRPERSTLITLSSLIVTLLPAVSLSCLSESWVPMTSLTIGRMISGAFSCRNSADL